MSERGFSTLADQVESLHTFAENPQQRVRTGIESLDILTEGPAAGEIYEILGRSFSGKSLVATMIMANNPTLPLIFFSLEMPARQALTRLYAQYCSVDHHAVQDQIRAGTLPQRFDELPGELPMHVIIDKSGQSLDDMTFYVNQYATYFEQRPAAVIIDYLELIRHNEGEGHFKTELVAKRLKDWAKEEEMAVFLLHQTNRTEKAWDAPTADSARGAGYTEADVVVGMWQAGTDPHMPVLEQQQLAGEISMNVIKNRINGRVTAGQDIKLKLEQTLQIVDLAADSVKRYYVK